GPLRRVRRHTADDANAGGQLIGIDRPVGHHVKLGAVAESTVTPRVEQQRAALPRKIAPDEKEADRAGLAVTGPGGEPGPARATPDRNAPRGPDTASREPSPRTSDRGSRDRQPPTATS